MSKKQETIEGSVRDYFLLFQLKDLLFQLEYQELQLQFQGRQIKPQRERHHLQFLILDCKNYHVANMWSTTPSATEAFNHQLHL